VVLDVGVEHDGVARHIASAVCPESRADWARLAAQAAQVLLILSLQRQLKQHTWAQVTTDLSTGCLI